MRQGHGVVPLAVLLILLSPLPLFGQETASPPQEDRALRLFMDCNAMACFDMDYLRREIPFVNWVRDIQDGDVYLLVTAQSTGAGGLSSELIFTGRNRFQGMADTLSYVSLPNDAMDAQREGLVGMIKIGLMRYVGLTPLASEIRIGTEEAARGGRPRPRAAVTRPEDDPWDFWVFSVRGSGSVSGESTRSTKNFSGSFSASRVTEEWKLSFSGRSSYSETNVNHEEIDYSSKSIRRDHSFSSTIVKALARKWSAGLRTSARNSTYYNYDFEGSISPVLEYSFFPYSESSRKSVMLQYTLDANYATYRDTTIYLKTEEAFVTQSLSLGIGFTQPWGNAYTSLGAGHHLTDIGKHHASVSGGITLRLSRGFSLNLSGSASRVKDQISVAKGAAETMEEVLLRRRQFQTDYRYRTSIGLTYRFGSMFNNVVNPRLDGGMGGGIMIIG